MLAADPAMHRRCICWALLANQVGQHAAAVELISQADPDRADGRPVSQQPRGGVPVPRAAGRGRRLLRAGRWRSIPTTSTRSTIRAWRSRRSGGWSEALASFERSLRLRPNHPETLNNVGVLLPGARPRSTRPRSAYVKPSSSSQSTQRPLAGCSASCSIEGAPPRPTNSRSERWRWHPPTRASTICAPRSSGRSVGLTRRSHSYQQALALQPDAPGTWINLGATLQVAGRPADAAIALPARPRPSTRPYPRRTAA